MNPLTEKVRNMTTPNNETPTALAELRKLNDSNSDLKRRVLAEVYDTWPSSISFEAKLDSKHVRKMDLHWITSSQYFLTASDVVGYKFSSDCSNYVWGVAQRLALSPLPAATGGVGNTATGAQVPKHLEFPNKCKEQYRYLSASVQGLLDDNRSAAQFHSSFTDDWERRDSPSQPLQTRGVYRLVSHGQAPTVPNPLTWVGNISMIAYKDMGDKDRAILDANKDLAECATVDGRSWSPPPKYLRAREQGLEATYAYRLVDPCAKMPVFENEGKFMTRDLEPEQRSLLLTFIDDLEYMSSGAAAPPRWYRLIPNARKTLSNAQFLVLRIRYRTSGEPIAPPIPLDPTGFGVPTKSESLPTCIMNSKGKEFIVVNPVDALLTGTVKLTNEQGHDKVEALSFVRELYTTLKGKAL